MSQQAIERVRDLERESRVLPQIPILTRHVIHAGMYARTICIPAGSVLTGAHITRATLLIISGQVSVFVGEEVRVIDGYQVIPASANRKQAFLTHADTDVTMVFPTRSSTIEEAEREFTDESDLLVSNAGANEILITGE